MQFWDTYIAPQTPFDKLRANGIYLRAHGIYLFDAAVSGSLAITLISNWKP